MSFWKEFQYVPEKTVQVQICRQETTTSRLSCDAWTPKENWDGFRTSEKGEKLLKKIVCIPKENRDEVQKVPYEELTGRIEALSSFSSSTFFSALFLKEWFEKLRSRIWTETRLVPWHVANLISERPSVILESCRRMQYIWSMHYAIIDIRHVLWGTFWKDREWRHWALIGQRFYLFPKLDSDWLTTSNVHKGQKKGW